MQRAQSVGSTQSSRFETFTEAVPLSLSSMAHASIPLEDGVLDGIRQILSHTLLSCVNYARIVHPPHEWTFRDLTTSMHAWTAFKEDAAPSNLPFALERLAFKHQYTRNAWIYLKPAKPSEEVTADLEKDKLSRDKWKEHAGILGMVTLLYVSKEPLTPGELDGTETEDMPATLLYKVVVEYRSLPATGNQQAVHAEELSMLSFGGSVDDDVKFGALASLYDEIATYVLEIFSVRGRKYKFDLMDSTLCDGTVPRLPSKFEGDPFVKCLCATVTEHAVDADKNSKQNSAITRMQLTLEGKPRKQLEELPAFDYMAKAIQASFLQLNPDPPPMATASPSGHTLLLDPALAGQVYINGRYVTHWGKDPRIGSHGVALFGMDLHSVPFWHGNIVDFEYMKEAYARLWQELLVDARLFQLNLASRLLYRLLRGYDMEQDEDDLYDDEESEGANVNADCLESQVLGSSTYDGVGIAAKALATRFSMEFGKDAFPCYEHEVDWAKSSLPGRRPVVVPHRLMTVLRRGGHFDTNKTATELWFNNARPPNAGVEKEMVDAALEYLSQAGCSEIEADQVRFVSSFGVEDLVKEKAVCRYHHLFEQFSVQEDFLTQSLKTVKPTISEDGDDAKLRAYLLGMYIAQAHPDGSLLARYALVDM